MNRGKREVHRSKDYGRRVRNRQEDFQSGRNSNIRSGRPGDREAEFDRKWAEKPRFDRSRSRSPHRSHSMAGLIFMCNKRTQRRCLSYQVLGMPMAKKRLADQIIPGMMLFLFEFESRELYGVYEATSLVGIDLEPKAFLEADIDFPLQVRFRVLHKCPPLRESEYRDAILDNYFEANRFKFDLTNDQVTRLLKLFLPPEPSPERTNCARNLHYPLLAGHIGHENVYHDFRGPPSANNNNNNNNNHVTYRSDDFRKDDHWKQQGSEPVPKASYIEGHNRLDYQEPPGGHISDYRHSYYEPLSAAAKLGSQRCETDKWCPRTEGYNYATILQAVPSVSSALHQAGSSTTSFAAPSKYDPLVSGYNFGRPEVVTLPPEAARFWKTDDDFLPAPAELHYLKAYPYSRQGLPYYSDVGNGERPVDPIPSKKPLLPQVEYLPPAQPSAMSSLPLTHAQKEADYRTYGSNNSRKIIYGYADDGISAAARQQQQQPTRYPIGLTPEGNYHGGLSIPDINTTKERYRRELSPRSRGGPVLPDAGGMPPPAMRYPHPVERENTVVEGSRHYEIQQQQQPPPPPYYGDTYEQQSVQQKPSVWDRVSGLAPPRAKGPLRSNGIYGHHTKRVREVSVEFQEEEFEGENAEGFEEEDESYVVDFKRRSKAEASNRNSNQPRKKKIVRPDACA